MMEKNNNPGKDIFDRIMGLPLLRIFEPFYKKNKSILMYLFFGALTTAVSIGVFFAVGTAMGLNEHIANSVSWIAAVTFAFFTNRTWVFDGKTNSTREFFAQARDFYGGRLFTYFVEEIIILVFVTILNLNQNVIKTVAQIIILVLNYVISKAFVFRKKPCENKD